MNERNENRMYGSPAAQIKADYERQSQMYRDPITFIIGLLSDVQERVERGQNELARQEINAVKLLLDTYYSQKALAGKLYEAHKAYKREEEAVFGGRS